MQALKHIESIRHWQITASCAAAPAVGAIPGASKFFVSLEDDLMGIFGSERMDSMLQNLGLKEGEAIRPWIDHALARAQHKVEALNYDIRKQRSSTMT